MTTPNLRETLNNANPNNLPDALREIPIGELLGFLIQDAGYTETGVTPSSNVATLAQIPSSIIDVVSTAGTLTGRLKLKKGGTPKTGEVVWTPGTKTLTLASVDAITALSVKYPRADAANTKASVLERTIAQRDVE